MSTNKLTLNDCSLEYSSTEQIHSKLRISVTDGCNFNCFFCHNEGQGRVTRSTGEMSVQEITRIVEIGVLSGIKNVKLTGGEPLLYSNNQNDILDLVSSISQLRESGLEFDLSITTNGSLLRKYAAGLKKAGLDRVTVSLPTLDEGIFKKFICRDEKFLIANVIDGIRAAQSAGLRPIKINTVIFYSEEKRSGNLNDIPEIIKLCAEKKIEELRFYPLLWHTRFALAFDEYYKYWDDPIFSKIIKQVEKTTDSCINLLPIKRNANNSQFLSNAKSRIKIEGPEFNIAFEMMKSGRFAIAPCANCEYPEICQEGGYALRVSSNGSVRRCVLRNEHVNLKYCINAGNSTDELVALFKENLSLLPQTNGGRDAQQRCVS